MIQIYSNTVITVPPWGHGVFIQFLNDISHVKTVYVNSVNLIDDTGKQYNSMTTHMHIKIGNENNS